METTFMTIHNLSPDANILFASESIYDILGYQPHEVIGRSCFDYFFVDDVPFARSEHRRNVRLDKAAVLYYARIKTGNNFWASCECVFTVVHDVLVACTSIYKGNPKSNQKEAEARNVRRLFSSPPRDPRYHMLEHLAPKFTIAPQPLTGEPRAALILNRFSRTLSIMYSTNAVANILGVSAEEMHGKSFYECIDESCLPGAIRCLESAKANDSIAYLRFVFRDPRRAEDLDQDQLEREASQASSDSEDGGVQLGNHEGGDIDVPMQGFEQNDHDHDHDQQSAAMWTAQNKTNSNRSGCSGSSGSIESENDSGNAMFDTQPYTHSNSNSSTSSAPPLDSRDMGSERRARRSPSRPFAPPMEVEAVISCTSDGLVVIIRAAPYAPPPMASFYANGFFAAPWGANPIIPQNNFASVNPSGPSADEFMNSIREVAVFAWALTGINGNIASYSHGIPMGEATPVHGFPIWNPQQRNNHDLGPENQAVTRWAQREKIEPPTLPLRSPFQHLQHGGRFSNQNNIANNSVTTPVFHAPMPTENGHRQRDIQYAHARPQYVPSASLGRVEQSHTDLSLSASDYNEGQGSSGSSHPVRYK